MAFAHRTVSPLAPELMRMARQLSRHQAPARAASLEGLEVSELGWDEWLEAGGERRMRSAGQVAGECRRRTLAS